MSKFSRLFTALTVVLALALLSGCTEKDRAKRFGGSMIIKLECGQKLFNLTWKESNLWYATRSMREGEVAETYTFVEDSNWGVMEGKVTFTECR